MTLGRTLRDAREASGMSIELLAKDTNIRPTLLLEMEADNFELCGGDTYARGHLRNIAKRIGIDAQLLINLYNDQHAVESQRIQDSLVENNVINVPREEKKLSWKIPAVVSLAILAIVGIVQIIVSNQSSDVPNKPTNSSSQTSEPSPTISANPSVSPTHGPIDLVISAPRGNSYIDIIVDGQDVEKGSIFQGETKKYKGTTAISIYFSNPAGLDVTLNGKLLAPLGGENQEVRRTFR